MEQSLWEIVWKLQHAFQAVEISQIYSPHEVRDFLNGKYTLNGKIL